MDFLKTPPSDIPTTGHTPANQDFHLYGCENQDGSASLLVITVKKSQVKIKKKAASTQQQLEGREKKALNLVTIF